MFDINLVARKIKELRIRNNMTQMNLADEMGVSYQAVSNWERGNSMPDISKLEELANILNCSIDELLGSSKETEAVKNILENADNLKEVKLEGIGDIMPILQPSQTHSILENIILSEEQVDLKEIRSLTPFLEEASLAKLLDKVDVVNNLQEVIALAPFLSEQALDKAVRKITAVKSLGEIVGLAPFLDEESLDVLVMNAAENGRIEECTGLYPFLSEKALHKIADILVKKNGISALKAIAPFL